MDTNLTGVAKTLLISLRARCLESLDPKGLIQDERSVEIARKLGCDLTRGSEHFLTQVGTAQRTLVFNDYTTDFLRRYPDGTVVNMACGLDTRFERLDNGQVRWFDLDLPGTIAVRRRFFSETDRFRFIEKSVLDFSWMDQIAKDRPVLFTAEGLFCYFTEAEVKEVLINVSAAFPVAEFVIEAISPLMVKHTARHPSLKGYDAAFKWGVNTGRETDAWQTGFRFVGERFFMSECKRRSFFIRLLCLLPPFAKGMKIFLLRKGMD